MLRTVNAQPTLWEAILPEMCLGLPAELGAVDRLLDDPVFFEPFRAYFHASLGRPSIPIETYLRLMFLKYRYRLGFEPLCREVADSISWQRFARIPLGVAVPHPTTLMKITTRCGSSAVDGLNEALLAKAAAAKVLKTNKVRADTTVIEANVAYPTDSGLLAKGVARMVKTIRRVKAAGLASRTKTRDRTRTMHARARSIGANLRRRTDQAKDEVRAINADMVRVAQRAVREARAVVRNARRALRQNPSVSGKTSAAIDELERTAERVERIAAQTRQRISGTTPDGATRLVSLHDPDARPIAKGRLGKPVEFGYKAQVADNEDGVVVDHNVEIGNPPDAPMLAPAIERIARRAGRAPRAVTADRGYGEIAVERTIEALGVTNVVLPTKGKPSATRRAHQQRRSFQNLVKWRTGSEGRISCLKRDFGWNRTRNDGIEGARTWCGHGVFNHNLIKIAALIP
ncbi:MAG: ISNCY family transposase [Acidimicrobiales bacterium]|nr:ISNCY family transposase [Acidimicrobiales bacterium]